jgi:carbon storage regulator
MIRRLCLGRRDRTLYATYFWVVDNRVAAAGVGDDSEEETMLVLTRKPGQSIMIGDGVEVQVLSVAGEKVRLGITAPRDVSIFRNEVYDRIENESSAGTPDEGPDDGGANEAVANALQRLSQR